MAVGVTSIADVDSDGLEMTDAGCAAGEFVIARIGVGVATTSRSTMTISGSLHAAINPTMQIRPRMLRIDPPVLAAQLADAFRFHGTF